MKRFVLNTRYPDVPANVVCIQGLYQLLIANGFEATLNDWDHYEKYDVAIFSSYDPEIKKAREKNPSIRVGLADPKTKGFSDAQASDFLLVSSIEQLDVFCRYNSNCFIYYMFPPMHAVERVHTTQETIRIGYHGNKVHLNALYPNITLALEKLGSEMPIEFWPMYNIEAFGPWRMGVPDPGKIRTRHIQWSSENYYRELAQVDIGIVPNSLLNHENMRSKKNLNLLSNTVCADPLDHLVRFKWSSNPGRIYVFSQLGIPVVADFFPSAAQFLEHGKRGFLAHSTESWYLALKELAQNAELRQRFASELRRYCLETRSREAVFKEFLQFLSRIEPSRLPNRAVILLQSPSFLRKMKERTENVAEYFFYSTWVGRALRKVWRLFRTCKERRYDEQTA